MTNDRKNINNFDKSLSSDFSTHPPTGFYSSTLSKSQPSITSNSTDSLTGIDEIYFPEVSLQLASNVELTEKKKKHKKMKNRKNKMKNLTNHEHVLISQCIDRKTLDSSKCNLSRMGSRIRNTEESEETPISFYESLIERRRFISLGETCNSIFGFFQKNPNFTKVLLAALLMYAIICNLEIFVPKIIAMFLRLLYPWTRYWAVIGEQFFNSFANMFTRLDGLIYATYCEFATKYCRNHRLMCDVSCSFVDHVLSQSRAQIAPQIQK